jgi:hypothetical protein
MVMVLAPKKKGAGPAAKPAAKEKSPKPAPKPAAPAKQKAA